jgi:GWxTD domain-containing protein
MRSALAPIALIGALLLASSGLLAAVNQDTNFLDSPTKDWRVGPIRYFLTEEEDDIYKKLKTEEERRAFIYKFWLLRDPTQDTPANEFKGEFRKRVLDANRLFGDTSKPGWKTDMGKIYILLGPPNEQKRDEVARTHRGVVIWTYRSLSHTTQGPNIIIAFAKDTTGEFRLSTSPTLDSEVAGLVHLYSFDKSTGMSQADIIKEFGRDPLLLAAGAPIGQSELELQGNLAEIMHLPPPDRILNELVTTEAYFDAIPFETQVNSFQALDGGTFLTITLGVSSTSVFFATIDGKDQPDVHAFARLQAPDSDEVLVDLSQEGTFQSSADNGLVSLDELLVFQAATKVEPGAYTLLIGLEDKVGSRVGTFRGRLIVPDYSGNRFRLSSLAVARRMDRLKNPPAPGPRAPYVLGTFRVIPDPAAEFRQSQDLNVYFQVYGADTDADTGKPDLEITYTFFQRQGDTYKYYGKQVIPHSQTQAQGYSIPLEKWPVGDYRLEVSVRDLTVGDVAVERSLFQILPND